MPKYSDILIEADDTAFDGYNQVRIIEDRAVILQDLVHAIRESGYLVEMIGERSESRRRLLTTKLVLLVEEDTRVVPGSVTFSTEGEQWYMSADTYDFGKLRSPVWI